MKKTYPMKSRLFSALFIFVTLFGHFGPIKTAAANTPIIPVAGVTRYPPRTDQNRAFPAPTSTLQISTPTQKEIIYPTWTLIPALQKASPTATALVPDILSGLQAFRQQVSDGQVGVVRGVYVEGVLSLRVIQQSRGDWNFVSQESGTATQFQNTGGSVTGLLAHNYLDGELFFDLKLGQEVYIIYGNGKYSRYQITDIQQYQKVDSNSTFSDLIDLTTGLRMSVSEVINRVYYGTDHITFQTCIEKDGNWTWGLIFIIATPI